MIFLNGVNESEVMGLNTKYAHIEKMIRQANNTDITNIEEILLNAVIWMHRNGLDNLWNESNIKWSQLSKNYNIGDFYISCDNNISTACMALTDYDSIYWPDIPKGASLYIHKLAVRREYAGRGISEELINFSKALAAKYHIDEIRLDCNQKREKLRELYEKNGFICVKENVSRENSNIALYVCKL